MHSRPRAPALPAYAPQTTTAAASRREHAAPLGLSLTREITKPLSRSAPPHTYRSRPLSPPQTKRRREDAARTSKTGRRDPRDSPRRPRPASNLTALDSPGAAPRARHVTLTLSQSRQHSRTSNRHSRTCRQQRIIQQEGAATTLERAASALSEDHMLLLAYALAQRTHAHGGHEPPYRGMSPHTGA